MDAKKFWLIWLKVIVILLIVLGVLMTFFNHSFILIKLYHAILDSFPGIKSTGIDAESRHWLLAVMGSMMIGWGINLYSLVAIPLKKGEKWAWNTLFAAMLSWYFLANIVSVYYGANFNIMFTTFILLQVLGPLLFLRPLMNRQIKINEA